MENFSMTEFNYFDVTISVVILILGIKGFMQGFIKEVFGLIGLIAGVYLAARYAPEAATFIDINFIHLENQSILKLIGFLSILVIIWLSATILGSIFAKLTGHNTLGLVNRIFGFIAASAKYFLIFALIVTSLSNVKLVKDNLGKYVKDSVLYPHLQEVGSYLIDLDMSTLTLKKETSVAKPTTEINTETNTTTQDDILSKF